MYLLFSSGIGNFDVFRWGALEFGPSKALLGTFITTILLPGIPLHYYGDEQTFYLFDNGASNYLFGRQPMAASKAWQRHGCYHLGSDQYFNMPLEKSLIGCEDDWNSLDHFDPTAQNRRVIKHFHHLRSQYPALQDGLNVVAQGNWTTFEQLPGSNQTQTELGLWTALRGPINSIQTYADNDYPDLVFLLYTNENATKTYDNPCDGDSWISTPFQGTQTIKNLIYPVRSCSWVCSTSPGDYLLIPTHSRHLTASTVRHHSARELQERVQQSERCIHWMFAQDHHATILVRCLRPGGQVEAIDPDADLLQSWP